MRPLIPLSIDVPTYISLWRDGSFRVGNFAGQTAELFAMSNHILMRVNPAPMGIVTYNCATQTPGRNVRGNRAAIRLKALLGPHMAFERKHYLVLDPIGFFLLMRLVTD